MKLEELAKRYDCEKWHRHSYIPFYEALFRGMSVTRLLEIGIGYREKMRHLVPRYVHGASLKMWRDYFEGAEIIGCDIRAETLFKEERIRTEQVDQSKVVDLWKLTGEVFGHY